MSLGQTKAPVGKYTVRPMDGMGYTLRISWDPAMEG